MRSLRNPVAILMIAALLGTIALYAFVLSSSSPAYVPLSEISSADDGRYVTTRGTLSDTGAPYYTQLTIRDNGSEITVVLDRGITPPSNLTPGDRVEVTGTVETYTGQMQIRIISAGSFVILERAGDAEIPVSLVLQDPERFDGTYLRTSGSLSSVREYKDHSRLLMRCRTGDIWLHSDSGDIERPEEFIQVQVTVCGQVEFNGLMDRYEILINTTDVFNGSGGEAVSASEILAGNVSEGTQVCITGFPDMGLYETSAYGTLENNSRTLSVVAYGDTADVLAGLDGRDVSVYGVLRYSTYSGTWRLVVSQAESKSF